MTRDDALNSLRPNAEWVLRGDELEWHDKIQTQPIDADIQAEIIRLQTEWDSNKTMRDWKEKIAETDVGMPRYLEDLITDNPNFIIHENMKTRYDEKIALRGEHP